MASRVPMTALFGYGADGRTSREFINSRTQNGQKPFFATAHMLEAIIRRQLLLIRVHSLLHPAQSMGADVIRWSNTYKPAWRPHLDSLPCKYPSPNVTARNTTPIINLAQ